VDTSPSTLKAAELPGRQPLDIQDYLEASSDASKRSRFFVIVLVVASVLVFAALLNSIQTQWLHLRMLAAGDIHSHYVETKLGGFPTDPEEKKRYEARYQALCDAIERAYVEASFVIKVPFFGISFDVNDLGLFGSAGFLVILTCYRFFLSRELDNLQISFTAARSLGKLELTRFYQLLSMRQVFTIPNTEFSGNGRLQGLFRKCVAKLITWIPLILLSAVIRNDYQTRFILNYIGPAAVSRFHHNLWYELTAVGFIFYLSIVITLRLWEMDEIWERCWEEIRLPDVPQVPVTAAPVAAGSIGH
jgi:hypothetical protein